AGIEHSVNCAQLRPASKAKARVVVPLDAVDVLRLGSMKRGCVASGQVEDPDLARDQATGARPPFDEGDSLAVRRSHGCLELPARGMEDDGLAGCEVEPDELGMIPAALAGVLRGDRDGAVTAKEIELPERIVLRANLDRRPAIGLDAKQSPARD